MRNAMLPPPPSQYWNLLNASLIMSKKGISNFDTPKKARMKGAADYFDHLGIKFHHNDLFRYHGISKEQGWAILKQDREQYD
jgi:hypothetical protein